MNSFFQLLGSSPWEIVATLCAVVSVILVARQNLLAWPLGIIWALISAWLAFFEWQLISDAILYLTYVPIQIYCWITWKRSAAKPAPFSPTWLTRPRQLTLLAAALLAIVLWGFGIKFLAHELAWLPAPALLWRDATTTVLNYFAQFLQARKRMENWPLWLVINSLGIHIYTLQGAHLYAIQYAFFLVLGLYGWWSWQKTSPQPKSC